MRQSRVKFPFSMQQEWYMDHGAGGLPPETKAMSYVSGLKIKCIKWFSD